MFVGVAAAVGEADHDGNRLSLQIGGFADAEGLRAGHESSHADDPFRVGRAKARILAGKRLLHVDNLFGNAFDRGGNLHDGFL